jgi:hypothetical protein
MSSSSLMTTIGVAPSFRASMCWIPEAEVVEALSASRLPP